MRERGSKLRVRRLYGQPNRVAPRAGAWIETCRSRLVCLRHCGRSPCGSVDRNVGLAGGRVVPAGRSPCGSVDRNSTATRVPGFRDGRSPCGSVDRNRFSIAVVPRTSVAPRAGAWIETAEPSPPAVARQSLPVRERGSKRRVDRDHPRSRGRRSPCGSVDRNLERIEDMAKAALSLPVRERGSKLRPLPATPRPRDRRSPCGSVDRNQITWENNRGSRKSLPVRERGSKPAWLSVA